MAVQPSTPPPSSLVNFPPTPKLGFEDSWIPYAPRKSARLSQRSQRIAQTPPPKSPSQISPKSTEKNVAYIRTPPTSSRKRAARSPPVSTANRRASSTFTSAAAATATTELGLDKKSGKKFSQRSLMSLNGMLPTPTKTPKKRPTTEAPEIARIARTLFPVRPDSIDEIMPSPKNRKNNTLGGFNTEEQEPAPIQVYTDSNERIPELDLDPNNPFYGDRSEIVPEEPSNDDRTVTVPGGGEIPLEDAENRDDGMVYVFRGKRIFRTFEETRAQSSGEPSNQTLNAELDPDVLPRIRGPLTRSSLKPRLLFPDVEPQPNTHDEEALTDVEGAQTPTSVAQQEFSVSPPGAPRFGNLSPSTLDARSAEITDESKAGRLPSPTGSEEELSAPDSPSPSNRRKRTKTSEGKGVKRDRDFIPKDETKTTKRRRHGSQN